MTDTDNGLEDNIKLNFQKKIQTLPTNLTPQKEQSWPKIPLKTKSDIKPSQKICLYLHNNATPAPSAGNVLK